MYPNVRPCPCDTCSAIRLIGATLNCTTHYYFVFVDRPFSGCYNKFYERGTYTCIVCDQELFSSETKYDSGCGWPAFNEVLEQGRVKLTKDTSNGERCSSLSETFIMFFLINVHGISLENCYRYYL